MVHQTDCFINLCLIITCTVYRLGRGMRSGRLGISNTSETFRLVLSAATFCPHTFSTCHLVTLQPLKHEMPVIIQTKIVTIKRYARTYMHTMLHPSTSHFKQHQPQGWQHYHTGWQQLSRNRSDCHKDTGGCIA